MKKTINALLIALFFSFAAAFVQAGGGDMHEPGYKCTNQPGCPQSQAVGAGGNSGTNGNSTITSALVELAIALVPKG